MTSISPSQRERIVASHLALPEGSTFSLTEVLDDPDSVLDVAYAEIDHNGLPGLRIVRMTASETYELESKLNEWNNR